MDIRRTRSALTFSVAAVCAFALAFVPSQVNAQANADAGQPWQPFEADFPFLTSSLTSPIPAGNTTNKALSIHVGPEASVAFDTDLLRMSAGWTGKFISPTSVMLDGSHGGHPRVLGDVQWGTKPSPGWADRNGLFADPRPEPFGPLPESWARFGGIHVVGPQVVLSYTVHGVGVDESPTAVTNKDVTVFGRRFRIAPTTQPLLALVADLGEGAKLKGPSSDKRLQIEHDGVLTTIAVAGRAAVAIGAQGRVTMAIPAARNASSIVLTLWTGPVAVAAVANRLASAVSPQLPAFKNGGPGRWKKAIVTHGQRGEGPGPYVIDRLTTPFAGTYYRARLSDWKDNVYKRRMMIGAFDFFSDGKRAAVATWEGDVWIVSGINDGLERLVWKRFASGAYEPLGLAIVKDVIYTSGRDQITRYHDVNGDGEADFYENFNNQVTASPGFHEFQFDLKTDAQGNFYTAKAGPVKGGGRGFGGGGGDGEITAMSGTVQKISADGKRREVYASGFRAPNGIGVSPTGQVTTGDNEGTWVPACPINWVKPGSFHGVESLAHSTPVPTFTPPLCWISKSYDNSGGSQVWVTTDKWGPFAGEMLHLSYGRAAGYLVLKQALGADLQQGGIVRLFGGSDALQMTGTTQKLTSSAMRGRFNPRDGQLYVSGLQGWQTDAVATTGFDRIRYTGKPVYGVQAMSVTSAGIHLTFTHALDPASVSLQNVSGERWNYRRSETYGSPEYSVTDPERRGHDRLEIIETRLSDDGKTLTAVVSDLRPANQMFLQIKVKAQDGTPIKQTVMHTIHAVPDDPRGGSVRIVQRHGKPGLDVTYSSMGSQASDSTLASRVALYVSPSATPSPLVPPGRFRAVYEGTVAVDLRGEHTFFADLAGRLTIDVGGKRVLDVVGDGRAPLSGQSVVLDKGDLPFRALFESPQTGDALLRLGWKVGATAIGTPIPDLAFRHDPAPRARARGVSEGVRAGRTLFVENRCARCHLSRLPAGEPELGFAAPSLLGIGSRRSYQALFQKVRNPHTRADDHMPVLLKGPQADREAQALAAFLAAQVGEPFSAAPAEASAEKGEALFTELNCGGCHTPLVQMMSDDGKRSLAGSGPRFPAGALAAFLSAPSAHNPASAMPDFRLTAAEAASLAAFIHRESGTVQSRRGGADQSRIDEGRTLFAKRQCVGCHELPGQPKPPVIDFSARRPNPAAGCLAPEPALAPAFPLGAADRAALRAFLKNDGLATLGRSAPLAYSAQQIEALGCRACHGKLEGFPDVDVLGGRLRPEWIAAFVGGRVPWKPRAARHENGTEWLPARMPAFASRSRALAESMASAHGYPVRTANEPPPDAALAKLGAQLLSATGGFSCVTCHAVGAASATQVFEIEGINLVHARERLLPAFFRRWVRSPLLVDPQTKMPTYFDDEGKSPVENILGGRAEPQIEAMWHYLRLVPAGTPPPLPSAP